MAVEPDDAKFISKLDEGSRLKAKEELYEINDEDRELAVQSFRQWILQQDWLKTPTDFGFLLRFLRARKFSQLGARETLENYWTVRTLFPDWCKNVDPTEDVLQAILGTGIYLCPKRYDSEGRRDVIDRTGQIDVEKAEQTWGLKNVFRALVLASDLFCLDENVQVNGVQVLFDATGITLNTATTMFTGRNGKNILKYFQRAQPARVKRLNLYKEPIFFDTIWTVVKPLMSEKVRGRLKLHSNSMVSVYQDLDKSLLPTEYLPDDYTGPSAGPLKGIIGMYKGIDKPLLPTVYLQDDYTGPSAGPLKSIIDDMLNDMKTPEFRSYIQNLSSAKYGVDFSKRKQHDQPAESFRKLHAE